MDSVSSHHLRAPSISRNALVALALVIIVGLAAAIVYTRSGSSEPVSPEALAFERVENAWVDGFPDMPRYPSAVILYSYRKAEEGKIGYEAQMEVLESLDTVAQWYIETLEQEGWSISKRPESFSGETYIAADREGRAAHIFLDSDDDEEKTAVSIEIPVQ